MSTYGRVPLPAAVAAMFLLGGFACSDHDAEKARASNAEGSGQQPPSALSEEEWSRMTIHLEPQLSPRTGPHGVPATEEDWLLVNGDLDKQNRYLTVVQVEANPPAAKTTKVCAGVLIAPEVVLTAANCICSGRKQPALGGGEQTVIDTTSCATAASVTVITYVPPSSGGRLAMMEQPYDGEARPHPSFKVVLDQKGEIVSSEADLAVIDVKGLILGDSRPVQLADAPLGANESLVMVGYACDEYYGAQWSRERHFRKYHVTSILDGGARALFDQPKRDVYLGESGGPCLRENGRRTALAGIMSRSLGTEASFTSTFQYRDWIRQEIRRSAEP